MAKFDLQQFIDGATVSKSVFELRPNYRALLLAMDGINPAASDAFSESLLQQAELATRDNPVTKIPHVTAWQEAYKAFGAKPKKFRNSLEALTRRAEKSLPRVNRLTDIYNAISVKNQIPLGGENLDQYTSPPRLIRATGQEDFDTASEGQAVTEHPDVGEVVWCDDTGVTCRRWNWRQGKRTALTDDTTSVLFILDALSPFTDEQLANTADELVAAIRKSSPDVRVAQRIIKASDRD